MRGSNLGDIFPRTTPAQRNGTGGTHGTLSQESPTAADVLARLSTVTDAVAEANHRALIAEAMARNASRTLILFGALFGLAFYLTRSR